MSAVYKAIHGVLTDLAKVGIGKDKTNSQQGFKYRGIDQIMDEVSSLLAKHGLLILPRVMKRECVERQSSKGNPLFYTILEIEYDFVGVEDGSIKVVGPFVGEAMDSADKSSNKAMAIAYKYACVQAFCIPLEGNNDPDGTSHEVAWDGRQIVDFVERFKGSMWRDVPQDFVEFVATNSKSLVAHRKAAESELARRRSVADQLQTGHA